MILYILRHAQAEDEAAPGGDEARQLTPRGRSRMRSAAAGLRRMDVKLDGIVTSPLARAAQTADIVAAAYANDPPPQVLPALSTGVAAADVVAALASFTRYDNLMIVGHEPQLSALVSLLLSGSTDTVRLRFKKGGCVALELLDRFQRGRAELLWMLTQRQLRKLGK